MKFYVDGKEVSPQEYHETVRFHDNGSHRYKITPEGEPECIDMTIYRMDFKNT